MEEKDEKKFEIEGKIEENDVDHDEDFEDEYEEERRGPWVYIFLVLFIILFLSAASLLTYFQFYQGKADGKMKWDFSFEKRTTAAMANQELIDENNELKILADSLEQLVANIDTQQTGFVAAFEDEGKGETSFSGEYFHVQIGAYSKFPFTNYGRDVNFRLEKVDGMNKIVIGSFDTFEDACAFRNDLLNLGLSGAFIIKTVDGDRVNFDKYCP